MTLREATDADVESIRAWRNHPRTRRTAIYTAVITAEHHRNWWSAVQADPARLVLIFERAGTPCGVVTINDYDPVARTAEWGFFLDVEGLTQRGELLPAWMELEREAVEYGFDRLHLVALGGRTLATNKQVLALHRRFGFVEVPQRGYATEIDGREQQVIWTELRRE